MGLLVLLLIRETCAMSNVSIADGHSLEFNQTDFHDNANSSLGVPSNQNAESTVTEAPASMVDPCQDSALWGHGEMNVFDKNTWESRYVICEDDTLTPCSPEASCCECKLVCIEGSNCTATGTSPTDEAPTSPSSKADPKNSGIPIQPGLEAEGVMSPTSFTGSSGLDLIALFVSLVILLSCCVNVVFILRKLRKRGLDYSRYPIPVDTADALTRPGAAGKDDPVYVAKVKRHENIIRQFHFRTIPFSKQAAGEASSSNSWGTNESGETSCDLECPTSPGSVRRRLQMQKKRPSKLSFWRRQAQKDECCICLENYGPGDTICVPIANSCHHMFHEECVVAWLQHNNRCPLCRVDLMKEVKVVDDPPPSVDRSVASSAEPRIPPTDTITITHHSQEMEEPHTSESDEDGQSEESDEDMEARQQAAEEASLNDSREEVDGEETEL
ncbi:unnamed protein product [Cylindrotheca closterium]|uniref:RING-type domain-containing protein n=1 Tax=Cylindrotheca closterium TaxID=2856 RepID=A0AAD2FYH3_9STRA|nr:unnamed protein product [Cylindrotheca closterium]